MVSEQWVGIREETGKMHRRKYIQKSYDDLNDIGGDCAGIDNHLFEVNAHFLEIILSRDKEDCDFEVCGNGLAAIFSGKSEMFQEYKDNKKYAIYNKYCKKR
ncbi:MAG: hypothetical protein IJS54_06675 [Desulfovibrio sp.]|nr:hypothetical protein [Desulfovibrio sp.]